MKRKKLSWTREGSCWVCTSHRPGSHGYPMIRREGYSTTVPRYIWIDINGPVPQGMYIRHSCHNRLCMNPAHLCIGTPKDNVQDMIRAGRDNLGRTAKLKPEDVRMLRREFRSGLSQREIARKHSVHFVTVHNVVRRKTWANIILTGILVALATPLVVAEEGLQARAAALREAPVPPPSSEGVPGPREDSFLITVGQARLALYSHRVRMYYEQELIPQYDILITDALDLTASLEQERDAWQLATAGVAGALVLAIILGIVL